MKNCLWGCIGKVTMKRRPSSATFHLLRGSYVGSSEIGLTC